ncbi:hypothetical protein DMENIID0001_022120 [Sergentomyia squamirostris]
MKSPVTVLYFLVVFSTILEAKNRNFTIYWNVPTESCQRHQVYFQPILAELRIVYNTDDKFSGEKIRILYNPGLWPSLEHGKEINGGMPHHGDLNLHLTELEQYIVKNIPKNYTGLIVIDMESWRPVFRQNTGWMLIYRNLTQEEIKKEIPNLALALKNDPTNKSLQNTVFTKAARLFEFFARAFMEQSMVELKKLRKDAKWGYYGFPYCFNMYGTTSATRTEACPVIVREENNETGWLFRAYDHWFPSVYIPEEDFSPEERMKLVRGRANEYRRLRNKFNVKAKIYPYVWFVYNLKENYLTEGDLRNTLVSLKDGEMDGAVIWGASNNLNSKRLCEKLLEYTNTTMRKIIEELQ